MKTKVKYLLILFSIITIVLTTYNKVKNNDFIPFEKKETILEKIETHQSQETEEDKQIVQLNTNVDSNNMKNIKESTNTKRQSIENIVGKNHIYLTLQDGKGNIYSTTNPNKAITPGYEDQTLSEYSTYNVLIDLVKINDANELEENRVKDYAKTGVYYYLPIAATLIPILDTEYNVLNEYRTMLNNETGDIIAEAGIFYNEEENNYEIRFRFYNIENQIDIEGSYYYNVKVASPKEESDNVKSIEAKFGYAGSLFYKIINHTKITSDVEMMLYGNWNNDTTADWTIILQNTSEKELGKTIDLELPSGIGTTLKKGGGYQLSQIKLIVTDTDGNEEYVTSSTNFTINSKFGVFFYQPNTMGDKKNRPFISIYADEYEENYQTSSGNSAIATKLKIRVGYDCTNFDEDSDVSDDDKISNIKSIKVIIPTTIYEFSELDSENSRDFYAQASVKYDLSNETTTQVKISGGIHFQPTIPSIKTSNTFTPSSLDDSSIISNKYTPDYITYSYTINSTPTSNYIGFENITVSNGAANYYPSSMSLSTPTFIEDLLSETTIGSQKITWTVSNVYQTTSNFNNSTYFNNRFVDPITQYQVGKLYNKQNIGQLLIYQSSNYTDENNNPYYLVIEPQTQYDANTCYNSKSQFYGDYCQSDGSYIEVGNPKKWKIYFFNVNKKEIKINFTLTKTNISGDFSNNREELNQNKNKYVISKSLVTAEKYNGSYGLMHSDDTSSGTIIQTGEWIAERTIRWEVTVNLSNITIKNSKDVYTKMFISIPNYMTFAQPTFYTSNPTNYSSTANDATIEQKKWSYAGNTLNRSSFNGVNILAKTSNGMTNNYSDNWKSLNTWTTSTSYNCNYINPYKSGYTTYAVEFGGLISNAYQYNNQSYVTLEYFTTITDEESYNNLFSQPITNTIEIMDYGFSTDLVQNYPNRLFDISTTTIIANDYNNLSKSKNYEITYEKNGNYYKEEEYTIAGPIYSGVAYGNGDTRTTFHQGYLSITEQLTSEIESIDENTQLLEMTMSISTANVSYNCIYDSINGSFTNVNGCPNAMSTQTSFTLNPTNNNYTKNAKRFNVPTKNLNEKGQPITVNYINYKNTGLIGLLFAQDSITEVMSTKSDENNIMFSLEYGSNMKYGFTITAEGFNNIYYINITYKVITDYSSVIKGLQTSEDNNIIESPEIKSVAYMSNYPVDVQSTNPNLIKKSTDNLIAYLSTDETLETSSNTENNTIRKYNISTEIGIYSPSTLTNKVNIVCFASGHTSTTDEEADCQTQSANKISTNDEEALLFLKKYLDIEVTKITETSTSNSEKIIYEDNKWSNDYINSSILINQNLNNTELFEITYKKESGNISAGTVFNVEYTIKINMDKNIDGKKLRTSDYYHGGFIGIENEVTSSTPIILSSGESKNIESKAGAYTEYLEIGNVTKSIKKELDKSNNIFSAEWNVIYDFENIGKDEYLNNTITDDIVIDVKETYTLSNGVKEYINSLFSTPIVNNDNKISIPDEVSKTLWYAIESNIEYTDFVVEYTHDGTIYTGSLDKVNDNEKNYIYLSSAKENGPHLIIKSTLNNDWTSGKDKKGYYITIQYVNINYSSNLNIEYKTKIDWQQIQENSEASQYLCDETHIKDYLHSDNQSNYHIIWVQDKEGNIYSWQKMKEIATASEDYEIIDIGQGISFYMSNLVNIHGVTQAKSSWGSEIYIKANELKKNLVNSDSKSGIANWKYVYTIGDIIGETTTITDTLNFSSDNENVTNAASLATEIVRVKISIDNQVVYDENLENPYLTGLSSENINIEKIDNTFSIKIKNNDKEKIVKPGSVVTVEYGTELNKEKFIDKGGIFSTSYKILNSVTDGSTSSTSEVKLKPISEINVEKEFIGVDKSNLSKANWKITIDSGDVKRTNLTITDNLNFTDTKDQELLADILSISSLKISVIKNSETTILYDSEKDTSIPEYLHIYGLNNNDLEINKNGISSFKIVFDTINSNSQIIVEYSTELDKKVYLNRELQPFISLNLSNKVDVVTNDNTKSEKKVNGYVSVTTSIEKTGSIRSNKSAKGNDIIEWYIDIDATNLIELAKLTNSELVVKDNLSSSLKLIESSIKVYRIEQDEYGITSNNSELPVDNYEMSIDNNSLRIKVLNPANNYMLRIYFQTECIATIDDLVNQAIIMVNDIVEIDETKAITATAKTNYGTIKSTNVLYYNPKAYKLLDGKPSDESFRFTIVEIDENGNELKDGYASTVENDTEGNIIFDSIELKSTGTKYFKVFENDDERCNTTYSCDSNIYTLKVNVYKNSKAQFYTTEELVHYNTTESINIIEFNNKKVISNKDNPNTIDKTDIPLLIVTLMIALLVMIIVSKKRLKSKRFV